MSGSTAQSLEHRWQFVTALHWGFVAYSGLLLLGMAFRGLAYLLDGREFWWLALAAVTLEQALTAVGLRRRRGWGLAFAVANVLAFLLVALWLTFVAAWIGSWLAKDAPGFSGFLMLAGIVSMMLAVAWLIFLGKLCSDWRQNGSSLTPPPTPPSAS